jgi:hypothetical protein
MTKAKDKWRSGPPPSLGWWQASVCEDGTALRWWPVETPNGPRWSAVARQQYSLESVGYAAKAAVPDGTNSDIKWLPRPASWPYRSRT